MNYNNYIILAHRQNGLLCEIILKKRFFDGIVEKSNYHFHSVFEVHICVKGSMHILVDDKEFFLTEGEVCIIPPNKAHFASTDENSVCTGFRFTFSNSGKNKNSESLLFENTYGILNDAVVVKSQNVYEKYLSVASKNLEENKPYFISANLIFIALYEIAEALTSKSYTAERVSYSEFTTLESIEDYINLNYDQKITIGDLANHLKLGKRQTQRIIMNSYGMTFTELLNKNRLTAAKLLLKTTDKSVEEISHLCGFEDKNYFYRRFSAMFGTTPRKYRNNF